MSLNVSFVCLRYVLIPHSSSPRYVPDMSLLNVMSQTCPYLFRTGVPHTHDTLLVTFIFLCVLICPDLSLFYVPHMSSYMSLYDPHAAFSAPSSTRARRCKWREQTMFSMHLPLVSFRAFAEVYLNDTPYTVLAVHWQKNQTGHLPAAGRWYEHLLGGTETIL